MAISELEAIIGRSVFMHPPRAALQARLVLLTYAAGFDVSVVIKHEIQLVLGIFNRHSWSHVSIFVPGHIVLAEHKVMFNFIFILNITVVQR